ncbi:hypothetical protein CJ255_17655, partial [Candidatus Viridilinea mediisalina]
APPGPNTAFFNFLASHDGIGVVPATGLLSSEQVAALCARVERHGGLVSYKNNPDGTQSAYELNCTWFDALSDPAADEPQALTVDRFVASQAIMLALQGVPGIYVHSLVGSSNNHAGFAVTRRARTLNRAKWERSAIEAQLADPNSRAAQVFARMATLIRTRRSAAAFHPNIPQRILDLGKPIVALERQSTDGTQRIYCLHNVTAQTQAVCLDLTPDAELHDSLNATSYRTQPNGSLEVTLGAYAVAWLVERPKG